MTVQLDHPHFPAPSPNTVIWRYSNFTKLLSLLLQRKLFLTSVRALQKGDPFEGLMTTANKKLAASLRSDNALAARFFAKVERAFMREIMIQQIDGDYDANAAMCFVSCWHESQHESAALWSLYSGTPDGVAIQSTVSRLTKSMTSEEDFILGRVNYHDYEKTFVKPGQALAPVFMKRGSFEHEKEVRLLYWGLHHWASSKDKRPSWATGDVDFSKGTMTLSGTFPPGLGFASDPSVLVERILVSPYAAPWVVDAVTETIRRIGFDFPVVRSNLMDGPQ